MSKSDHYAILVTITEYPGLSDLKGPEPDGDAVTQWLTNSEGGNMLPKNVIHIKTSDFKPFDGVFDANPTEIQFKKALDNLLREGQGEERQWKDKVGERLYLYFAGHGFTSGSSHADPAVFTAIAQDYDTAHIAGYRYAAKIANAGFFDEILLFMDCCQDVLKSSNVVEPTWSPPDRNRSGSVKFLQGIGAPRGKKAYERDLDGNGETRGLFTVVLLEALRTAIPDQQGWVNGHEFKRQFSQIWSKRFQEETDYHPPIRLPDGNDIRIYRRTPSPSFGNPPLKPDSAAITVNLPQVNPELFRNITVTRQGSSFEYVQSFNEDVNTFKLPTGMFTIETAKGQNDYVFEVLPSEGTQQVGHIEFFEVPPLSVPIFYNQPYMVRISSTDSAVQIEILDSDYNTLALSDGSLAIPLIPGVYKAQLTAGGIQSQKIFRVVNQELNIEFPSPEFSTAAPVTGSSTSHEYQSHPAYNLATSKSENSIAGLDSELMVFVRASKPEYGSKDLSQYPWENLLLRNYASDNSDLWSMPLDFVNEDSFFAATKVTVTAGSYLLCSVISEHDDTDEICLALCTVPGWRTEVYLDSILESTVENGTDNPITRPDFTQASIHLVRINEPPLLFDEIGNHTELLRSRLATGYRPFIPTDEAVMRSPMLGIYAAYTALQYDQDDKSTIEQCLGKIPDEIRSLADIQLLESWINSEVSSSLLQPLDIPILSLAWDLSRKLPQERQLAPELRGILGQWRISGSIWTIWRRPTQVRKPIIEQALLKKVGESRYHTVLASAQRLTTYEQAESLDPAWEIKEWIDNRTKLRIPTPGYSPFQQALRRRLLDAMSLEEDLSEENIFQLGAEFDLDRRWVALEYKVFYESIV